jgi:hypothetical protein
MTGSKVEVSTKLGPHTLARASFQSTDFPSDAELQTSFLKSLMQRVNPAAYEMLDANASQCLEDQAKAVRKALHGSAPTSLN